MEGVSLWFHGFLTIIFLGLIVEADRGRMYMVTSPPSIVMPLNDETLLTCEMNINPDKFKWRYYPLRERDASNPFAQVDLATHQVIDIPSHTEEKKISKLRVRFTNKSVAGDYQCLAYYGASVVASIPGRITLTSLEHFDYQPNVMRTVVEGNTVIWRCEPPKSNPPAYVEYTKNRNYYNPTINTGQSGSLILYNVTTADTGRYGCRAGNMILDNIHRESSAALSLTVVKRNAPQRPSFILNPLQNYTVKKGDNITLECSAVGYPVPSVTWSKQHGHLPSQRTEQVVGGLLVKNVTANDDGIYICKFSNSEGVLEHRITLIYNEPPKVTAGPSNTHRKEGSVLELYCNVTGTPEPKISWFLNGESVLSDKQIEAVGRKIYFNPLEKRHAGILQCFASNAVGIDYSSADLNVIPKQISSVDEIVPTHSHGPRHKKNKTKKPKMKVAATMVPPLKPNVTRVSDESVVVRWMVPPNNGLPIQFFKVQYRELGHSNDTERYSRHKTKWMTISHDIPPNIMSYEVNNLKPEHQYRFRIAAVYSNNDNKLSPKSDTFTLSRGDFFNRNPLPIPRLTHTEPVNATAIKVFWEYIPTNVSIDGFFINYLSASSAGDYTKDSVDGEFVSNYVITHLSPDTVYDIKMQSFNTKSASDFTPILKEKTLRLPTKTPTITSKKPEHDKVQEIPKKYIFIGAGVALVAIVATAVISLVVCKRWKKKKDMDNTRGDRNDKNGVEEVNHHIQVDTNNYVATPKSLPRTNGIVIPPNRITITSNPLADSDNKSQNMIEMSCLSSQNNNRQASGSEERDGALPSPKMKKEKTKHHNNMQPVISGENYV